MNERRRAAHAGILRQRLRAAKHWLDESGAGRREEPTLPPAILLTLADVTDHSAQCCQRLWLGGVHRYLYNALIIRTIAQNLVRICGRNYVFQLGRSARG